ncbi:DUF3530 family protein [Marinobacter sp. LN3S78]|uniref:DUF3530 family protein n=1 Tax=Marinobacter sp. LN3S78 TaxID=3382300 RepID=UPI00387B49F8
MAIQQHYSALLVLLALLVTTPVTAQDGELADNGNQNQEDGAAAAEEGETPPAEPLQRIFIRSSGDAGALAQQYPHLAVWLEPEDEPRVLALVEREVTARPSGGVVILAGEGQSANDSLLKGLRSRLSEAGWAAMTLGLEQPSPSLEMARERLADNAPSGDGDGDAEADSVMIDVNDEAARDLLEAHRKTIGARLTAAVAWFTGKQYQRVILVGVGRGADEVRAFLPEAPAGVSQAVWVAADFGGQSPATISDALSGETTPILDLYPSRNGDVAGRQAAFRRAGIASYQAMSAPVPMRPAGRDAGVIANRLLGWLGKE